MQIGRDQHEPEIGFRRDHAHGEQLRVLERADFLHERSEARLRFALLFGAQELPLAELDPVIQMEAMPALFGNERSVVLVHTTA